MKHLVFTSLFLLLLAGGVSAQFTSIYDIQYVPDPATDDASPLVGDTVTVEALVTFEPMSAGGNKFFVCGASDFDQPWTGIQVYTGDEQYHLGYGWRVHVTGVVEEYYGMTQINASEPGAVVVQDNRPDPVAFWQNWHVGNYWSLQYHTVDPSQLSDPATAEAYEGMQVRVMNVDVVEMPNQYGEWDVGNVNGNVAIDNPASSMYGYKHWVLEGQHYNRIQGILHYNFNEYKIMPEIAWDLNVAVDPANGFYTQVPYIQQVRPMDITMRLTVDNETVLWDHSYASRKRYGFDEGPDYGEDVVVRAVITYPTELGYAGGGAKFIMTDYMTGEQHSPWTSILSYNPDPGTLGELFLGDEIVFHGEVGEYSTGPSNFTELWITDPFEFLRAGAPLPAPAPVVNSDLRDPIRAEQWEAGNVMMTDAIVTNTEPTPYELFAVNVEPDGYWGDVKIDDDSEAMADFPDPPQGATVLSLSGWVYHHYGVLSPDQENVDWVYKICPLYPEDVVLEEEPPLAEVQLTPHADPVQVPQGAAFFWDVAVNLYNIPGPQMVDVWTEAVLPNGNVFGPVAQYEVQVWPGMAINVTGVGTQIPASAPLGTYTWRMKLGNYPNFVAASDEFAFTVVAGSEQDGGSDWTVSGLDRLAGEAVTAETELPDAFALADPYPNPFNPATTVTVALPDAAELNVTVYNVHGRQVAELARGSYSAGQHDFVLDGSRLASGLYFVRMAVPGQFNAIKKVTLMK